LLSWVTNNGPTRLKNTKCSLPHLSNKPLVLLQTDYISP
jgi:hypothetical protein